MERFCTQLDTDLTYSRSFHFENLEIHLAFPQGDSESFDPRAFARLFTELEDDAAVSRKPGARMDDPVPFGRPRVEHGVRGQFLPAHTGTFITEEEFEKAMGQIVMFVRRNRLFHPMNIQIRRAGAVTMTGTIDSPARRPAEDAEPIIVNF